MKISILMQEPVLKIDGDLTVEMAAEMMGKNHVGSLLVTKGKGNVGIVTERDVLSKVIAEKLDLEKVKVKEIMSKPLVTVDKDTEAEEVINVMAGKGVRRVLVTDEETIVGIFSTSDITKLAKTN
jgi:CBS domain-containing protein